MQDLLQPQALAELHRLPMTRLEKLLRRCKEQRPEAHGHALTAQEMAEYMQWMVTEFGSRADFSFPQEELLLLTGGGMADVGQEFAKGSSRTALSRLTDVFTQPNEPHYFSAEQSISASRFLRHMPAYWHSSTYFEVYYVFSGSCPVWFEQERIDLVPGSLLLIPPGVRKACQCPQDDSVMFFYLLRASTFEKVFWQQLSDQNLMSLFFKQALAGNSHTAYLRFDTGQDPALEGLLHGVFREYRSSAPYSVQITNAMMNTFFPLLLQRCEHTLQLSRQGGLYWKPEYAALLAHIQAHYQNLTLTDLSRLFCYSERQLIRIIRRCTGKTFAQLLLQLRMEQAALLLVSENIATEEIAARVGYPNVSSFYRAFGAYFGCPPRVWMRKRALGKA